MEKLQSIWIRPDFNNDFSATSFIVVGPIPKEKDFNVTTGTNIYYIKIQTKLLNQCSLPVDLLFEHIYGCLEHGAVLLTIHPLEIDGKIVKDSFLSYEPNKLKYYN